MKSKEEVIKEAYGAHWETVKDFVDENGWCKYFNFDRVETGIEPILELYIEQIRPYSNWRPKSLQGIETNNGWISINSEKDLPSDKIDCHFFTKEDNEYIGKYHPIIFEFRSAHLCYGLDFVTHYAPIEKKQPPLHK